MLVKLFSSSVQGIDAQTITIEVTTGGALTADKPGYALVGLADHAIKEGYWRIQAAIKSVNYQLPRKRIIINMAPADLRKEGSNFDLPIAIAILLASEQLYTNNIEDYIILGELALDGTIRSIKGSLPIAIQAQKDGFKALILPKENAREAAIVKGIKVYGVEHINEVIDFLNNSYTLSPYSPPNYHQASPKAFAYDFKDVKGQQSVKRALEVAAAGGHNALLLGPPGSGKSMLSQRLPSILPPLSLEEALETTKIHSVSGLLPKGQALLSQRPFRSPHHTISDVALVGGGSIPRPGEISLAHNGLLFLDEFPEFKRSALEVLRQPMENRKITISRSKFTVEFPANFMLIASMNPCPCGYFTHPLKDCVCSKTAVQRYLNKISGPLLDRIDLHIEVKPLSFEQLNTSESGESSQQILQRVLRARQRQEQRFKAYPSIHSNAQMPVGLLQQVCQLNSASQALLNKAMKFYQLSARAYERILKVARTIADLEDRINIELAHIAEAVQYRSLDKENWLS